LQPKLANKIKLRHYPDPAALVVDDDFQQPPAECLWFLLGTVPSDTRAFGDPLSAGMKSWPRLPASFTGSAVFNQPAPPDSLSV